MTLKSILVVFAICLVLVIAKKSSEQEAVEKEAKLSHKKYSKYEQEQYVKRCPLGWSRPDKVSKCFKLFLNETDHSTAESECNALGSTLASFGNDLERNSTLSMILKQNVLLQQHAVDATGLTAETNLTSFWIGLRRTANLFFWYDLSSVQTEGLPWASNEPSVTAGDDCGFIASDHETLTNSTADFGKIRLGGCTQLKGFICQKFILDYCNTD